jgi:nitrogen regulatory protein PII
MKMILMYADATRLEAVRKCLKELDAPGYTVVPVEEGAGRTGVHTGDRVHPGALALVMVIEEDAKAEAMFDELVRRRDAHGDHMSKLFLMPVLRQA